MSNLHVRYLLAGGGLAGGEAAKAIRGIDPQGDLLLVGQEINRPYHRPPLSKEFLRGRADRASLFTLPAEWFVERHVQLRTGTRVSHLDTTRNCATLDNGIEISFDRLLIATGGVAKPLAVPGADLPGLHYVRTLEDTERLQHAIEKARREGRPWSGGRGRVVIAGAGVLGVELAASLSHAGLQVDLAVSGDHPWNHFAGDTTGRCLSRLLESHGIALHPNGPVVRLEGDGRVQHVFLASGQALDCDFTVAAVGMQINRELLRGTSIDAEKAILVDQRCRTSMPDIYAAGDCAAVFDPLFGKHRMMHHWDSAARTGRIAGTNMAGGNARFDVASYFDSQVFDLSVDVWGEAKVVDRRIIRGTPSGEMPDFVEIGVAADGRIAQAIAIGHRRDIELLAELVRRRVSIAGREEQIKDPAIPLQDIVDQS